MKADRILQPAAEKIFGLPKNELIGKNIVALITNLLPSFKIQEFLTSLEKKNAYEIDFNLAKRSAQTFKNT
jgi:PAS domain-containing protein